MAKEISLSDIEADFNQRITSPVQRRNEIPLEDLEINPNEISLDVLDEPSFAQKALDIPIQVGSGIVRAAKETFSGVETLTERPAEVIRNLPIIGSSPVGTTLLATKALATAGAKTMESAAGQFQDPQSLAGAFARGTSQFLAGYLPANKALKVAGMANVLKRSFAAGALADFSVFDPYEERLSNLIQRVPALQNPVTEYLAADADDTKLEGRMKQVAEGVLAGGAVGLTVEGITRGVKLLKAVKNAKATKAVKQVKDVADPQVGGKLFRETDEAVQAEDAFQEFIRETGRGGLFEGENPLRQVVNSTVKKGLPKKPKEVFTEKMRVDVTEKVIDASKPYIQANRDLTKKISDDVADALRMGEINFDDLPDILKKYNISDVELAQHIIETRSFAGQILNRYSQLAKAASKSMSKEAVEVFERAAKQQGENFFLDVLANNIRRVENWRRGLLVTQLTTAVRNVNVQVPRLVLQTFDEALQTAILGTIRPRDLGKLIMSDINAAHALTSSAKRGLTHSRNIINKVTGRPQLRSQLDKILDGNQGALQKARLLSQPVMEVATKHRGLVHYLNIFNRTQEYFFRKIAFEAKLRQGVIRRGLGTLDTVDPNTIPEDAYKEAVDFALEMTFARSPESQAAKVIATAWRDIGLTTVNPFPRFAFSNALPFVWQHSPIGYIDALRSTPWGNRIAVKAGMRDLGSKLPEHFARSASRATLGTMMLWSAWHLRQSKYAGDNWYELIPDPENKPDEVIDLQSYAPLSTTLFMADAIRDYIEGTNKIKPAEYAKMLVGLNRLSGSGLVFVDMMRAEKPETVQKMLGLFAGQYIGSFGVPIRTVKDVVAIHSTEEAIVRNVKEDPLWAPFINNIPILSQNLPPQTTPFREGIDFEQNVKPLRIDETTSQFLGIPGTPEVTGPAARQFFGITKKKKFALEREIDRLDVRRARLYARTGNEKANRLINGYTGYINETFLQPVIESPVWQQLPDPVKKLRLEEMVTANKKRAMKMFGANHPDLMMQLDVEKMDNDELATIGLTIDELKRELNIGQ